MSPRLLVPLPSSNDPRRRPPRPINLVIRHMFLRSLRLPDSPLSSLPGIRLSQLGNTMAQFWLSRAPTLCFLSNSISLQRRRPPRPLTHNRIPSQRLSVAGTSSPQDRIAYHQYISDAKAAILTRNFPPLSQDACQVAEDQGPLPPVYQRAATPHGIDGISHLSEIDELMQPVVLSPCPSPPHGQPSPRGQTQPLLSRPNTPLPGNIETEDIIVIQSSPPVSRKRRSDGHQSPPKRVALYSLDTESDTEAEPQLPPRPKRDHRKGASKNPRGPPSAISRKRRAKQVFSQSDKEKLYACPANVFLKWKCPIRFHSANGMRLHCRTFHPILEVKPAKCSCHLTGVGGRTARENACRLAGCVHVFADVSDQGDDATWSPGHDRRSLHFYQELPS
jgi:hypothetical protein